MDILRTATDVILLRPPNFTDYWNHTSPLCLLDPYHNQARQSTFKTETVTKNDLSETLWKYS